jgi:hypothetical protein
LDYTCLDVRVPVECFLPTENADLPLIIFDRFGSVRLDSIPEIAPIRMAEAAKPRNAS